MGRASAYHVGRGEQLASPLDCVQADGNPLHVHVSSLGRWRVPSGGRFVCYPARSGMADDDLLIGDEDRERTVSALNQAYVAGKLTEDELEVRVGQATGARTDTQLRRAVRGLPAPVALAPVPNPSVTQRPPERRPDRPSASPSGYASKAMSMIGLGAALLLLSPMAAAFQNLASRLSETGEGDEQAFSQVAEAAADLLPHT